MKKRTKLKFYDVILYLVIFVFIGASIGGLAYLGKLMFSGYTDFSVSYDGLEYKASSEDLT